MKKIILVNASPRAEGNCAKAMEIITKNVKDADVEIFNLREKTVNPCYACNACKAKDVAECVQKDDMGALLEAIDGCDAMVFASPIYFSAINGPAKTFIDRLYPFFNPKKENMTLATKFGKKMAIILTAGSAPEDAMKAHGDSINRFAVAGFTESRVMPFNSAKGADIFGVEENAEVIAELAAWLSE